MLEKSIFIVIMIILCWTAGFAQTKYVVKKGDNLTKIAKQNKVTVEDILRLNNIEDEKKIKAGDTLTLKLQEVEKEKTSKPSSTSQQKNNETVSELSLGNKETANQQITDSNFTKIDTGNIYESKTNPSVAGSYSLKKTDNEENKKDKTENLPQETEKSSSWWWLWLLLGIGGGVYCWEKWLRKFIFSDKSTEFYIEDLKRKISDLKEKKDDLERKNKNLERENKEIREEIAEKDKKIQQVFEMQREKQDFSKNAVTNTIAQPGITQPNINAPTAQNSTLYADCIIDGYFNRVVETPNEDTIYEITLVSDNKAIFGIYIEAHNRVIRNPDFIDGCDKQKINLNSQTLEVEEGESTKDGLGKWQICKKAKIKFV